MIQSLTFVDTSALPRVKTPEGEVTEILNERLEGAKNVFGTLRWLANGETFHAAPIEKHQLIYFMEGQGTVGLEGRDYEVARGGGVYLGPAESAVIRASGGGQLKLFHLIVPRIPAAT